MAPAVHIGDRRYDLTTRALVMGIANRTPDSFFDRGSYFEFDRFLEHCDRLVTSGADIVDVGGVKAGAGEEVSEAEELERVVPAVEAVVRRFEVAVSVDTWRAAVAREAFAVGARVGNDISGFSEDGYLAAAAGAGATVVATHIRLRPRVPDLDPRYDDLVGTVEHRLLELAEQAEAAGVPKDRIVLDAGLDLGKTTQQSLALLHESARLAGHGYPLLLSASNKTFLGEALDLVVGERRQPSLVSAALGIIGGCRLLRVHDVPGTVRARDVIACILESDTAIPTKRR